MLAGFRMDGFPALDLWDVVIEVLHSSNTSKSSTQGATGNCSRNSDTKLKKKGNRDVDQLSDLDHVVTNASSSQCEVQLYIFEDNEAVIKMIIKSRNPMMRHVSRSHRVALDWLFDTKIQIKYVDTKNQFADMLIEGSFTGDEWNHLLRLFNIMNFSMFSCSHLPSNMPKSAQERGTEERPAVAKSKVVSLISRSLSANPSPTLDSDT